MTVHVVASGIPPLLATTQDSGGAGPTIAFLVTVTVAVTVLGLMVRRVMTRTSTPQPPSPAGHDDAVGGGDPQKPTEPHPRSSPDAAADDDGPPPRDP